MKRILLDTSRLPQDVLTYTNLDFFNFIHKFCGKDEADLLKIQAVRTVDSFLAIKDLYSIFSLDSDDVKDIQARCGFRSRTGAYSVRPGIKSSLDYIRDLLEEMQRKTYKIKTNNQTLAQSPMLSSEPNPTTTSDTNIATNSLTTKKTEIDHYQLIEKSIGEWCNQHKKIIKTPDLNLVSGIDYHVQFNTNLDKCDIKCSCGSLHSLFLSESGNFKLSNFFRHLKTNCSLIEIEIPDKPTNDDLENDDELSSNNTSQQATKTSVRKRTRRTAGNNTSTKKSRSA